MFRKKDFGQAPSNYIAGRGRGAVGFITRSDIGPAKVDQVEEPDDYNDAKYDEWNGYSVPLFNVGDYDEEDREADVTYNNVDKKMDERRVNRRKEVGLQKPSLVNQFSDLKRDLAKMTQDEWLSIPDIGDYSIKKKRQDRITPAPDSLLLHSSGIQSKVQDLNEIGETRGALLGMKLDKMSDSVAGQSVVDTRGYLTSLAQLPQFTESDIGDFKKARLLLKSVIQTDPKNSFGWVAAARIEELDGKLQAARNILAQGLQKAEDQEDIWIELARLETTDKAKSILAKGVQTIPTSLKLWMSFANREQDVNKKINILKRALEFLPASIEIWTQLISQTTDETQAKILLYKAVECAPKSLQLWLALAKLETYENAKTVLNKARQNLPQEASIWIHSAKLEESAGKDKTDIAKVLHKGIKILQKNGVKIVKDEWFQEAEMAERTRNNHTCWAMIEATINIDNNLSECWMADYKLFEQRGSIQTARAILDCTSKIDRSQLVFSEYLQFETRHSKRFRKSFEEKSFFDPEYWHYDDLLASLIVEQSSVDQFWIEAVNREYELKQSIEEIMSRAPLNEEIYIAASRICIQAGNLQAAKVYLNQEFSSVRSLIKLYKLQVLLGEPLDKPELAVQKFENEELWILYAQNSGQNNPKIIFEEALLKMPKSVKLWVAYIQSEPNPSKARPIVDRAKIALPKNAEIWLAAIRLEINANQIKTASFLLNKALQDCPRNGELWALSIELEPKNTRKKKSASALTLCVDDPHVYLSTAKVFLKEGKEDKAKKWLEKALILDPRLGDAWAYLYILEKDQVVQACIDRKPKSGRLWKQAKEITKSLKYETILIKAAELGLKEIQKIE